MGRGGGLVVAAEGLFSGGRADPRREAVDRFEAEDGDSSNPLDRFGSAAPLGGRTALGGDKEELASSE